MVQNNFTVGTVGTLTTVLAEISTGGTNAAADVAYNVTLTAGIFDSSASVTLLANSSLTLEGPFLLNIPTFDVSGTLTTDLDFTGTVTLNTGVFDNVALVVNSGGTTIAGEYTGAVLGTVGDGGDTAINAGTIVYTGPYAAIEFDNGTIQNGWNGPAAALVSGVAGGAQLEGAGLVQNGGTIISSGTASAAVYLGTGTVDNGQLGDIGATISGGENGVEIYGAGTVNNDGTIIGVSSDAVYLGLGTVQNGASNDITAQILGGPTHNGVWIAGNGSVDNFGTISGGGASGVLLDGGGTLANGTATDTTALVSGAFEGVVLGASGAVFNDGTIQGIGSDATQAVIGAFFEAGGTLDNLTAAAVIGGEDWGAVFDGAAGSVINAGTIRASGANGLGVDLTAGGTVTNGSAPGSAATISGGFDGVRIAAGAAGAGAVVLNDGTIAGGVGVDFLSGATAAAGTLTNAGLIESTAGATGYAVVFGTGTERLVLQPGAAFVGGVLGSSASGSSTTMELAYGTHGTLSALAAGAGTVTDTAGSFGFTAFGTIAEDAGATWAITGPGSLINLFESGTLAVSGGAVTVTGSLANGGSIAVTGGSLIAAAGVLTDQGTITVGAGALLEAAGGGITSAGTADLLIDSGTGTAAVLTVTGSGATASSNGHRLAIGATGQGSVVVSAGGTLLAGTQFATDPALDLGGIDGASGALTVTGNLSRLTAAGPVDVGLGGIGDLLIANQASVVTGGNTLAPSLGVDIGVELGASGAVSVSGDGVLSNTGGFVVGDAGLADLSIEAAGTVITSPGTVAGLAGAVIANAADAAGSAANVGGAGSDWRIAGTLVVGNAGDGALNISDGGTVVSTAGTIAAAATAAGSAVNVAGNGSDWRVSGNLVVGNAGAASLDITAGGTVSATTLNAAAVSGSDGVISISGDNSSLITAGTLSVGTGGAGELSILSGANVNIGGDFDIGTSAGASGNVDIEDTSGTVFVGGNLNLGVNGGVAVLTVGYGSTLEVDNGGVNGGPNAVLIPFSPIDPFYSNGVTYPISSTQVQSFPAYVADSRFNLSQGVTYTLETPAIYAGSGFEIGAGTSDTEPTELVLNAGSFSANSSVTFESAVGTLVVGVNALATIATPISGTSSFTKVVNPDAGVPLIGSFDGTLKQFQAGDVIIVDTSVAATFSQSGSIVSVIANGTTLGALTFDSVGAATAATSSGLENEVVAAPCFAAGTRIATARGEVAVEDLAVGDRVPVVLGEDEAEIIWIGQRSVNCARHPNPASVWPVRIAAGAFGVGQPHTELWLSPDHAVYVNDVLIPVRHLINGTTIVQVKVNTVTYYHLELPRHDVLLAEGLSVESYLDMKDGSNYANRPGPVRLYPDFSTRMWDAFGCAKLIVTGPELESARATLLRRARHAAPPCEPPATRRIVA